MCLSALYNPHFNFSLLFFFFNDTATTEIYTLSLHDALPICPDTRARHGSPTLHHRPPGRSEEHTSELQSHDNLVCRLLLEKKNKNTDCNSMHHRRQPHDHPTHVVGTA